MIASLKNKTRVTPLPKIKVPTSFFACARLFDPFTALFEPHVARRPAHCIAPRLRYAAVKSASLRIAWGPSARGHKSRTRPPVLRRLLRRVLPCAGRLVVLGGRRPPPVHGPERQSANRGMRRRSLLLSLDRRRNGDAPAAPLPRRQSLQ